METETVSPKLTHKSRSVVSETRNTTAVHSSNNAIFPCGDSFLFEKPLHISESDISSIFGHKAPLPDFDPVISRDFEIPWVPRTSSQEVEPPGNDITLDDFFGFAEQNPGMQFHQCLFVSTDFSIDFPVELPSEEPSFEIPRRSGFNDSYMAYISQVSRDSKTQRSMLDEILDSYGSRPGKDTWSVCLDQSWFPNQLLIFMLII